MPATLANRYRIEKPLGAGGMGTVVLAEDAWRPGRRVALKSAPFDDVAACQALESEFAVLRQLRHPGVVAVLDFGACEETRQVFFTMEHADGCGLTECARDAPFARIAELLASTCRALAFVHSRGIVHRDLKSANVVVVETEAGPVARLLDFGLAAHAGAAGPGSTFSGTISHAAPEMLAGSPVDGRADLYALGVTLYLLLTGRMPFEATDATELMHAHIAIEPVAPDQIDQRIAPSVGALVHKLMAKHAEDRYFGAAAVERDLVRCARALEQGRTEPFELASDDIPHDFRISRRLYGRELQVAQLLDGFERARTGTSCVVTLVGGYSGVGKSAVVGSLYRSAVQERGHFIGGKFDQYKRDIPYATLVQAFRELMRDLLGAGDAVLADWRGRLSRALARTGESWWTWCPS